MAAMQALFDSLGLVRLNALNRRQDPCAETKECRTHNILTVRGFDTTEFSDARRCMIYDSAYLAAFARFEAELRGLEK
jgi:hypothetical protein